MKASAAYFSPYSLRYDLTKHLSPWSPLISSRGYQTTPSHPFLTVCFPLYLLVPVFLPCVPFPFWGFNILSAWQSVCISRGFCHTLPLVCFGTPCTPSFLFFFSGLQFPLPGSCTVFHLSICCIFRCLFLSLLISSSLSLFFSFICQLWVFASV